LDAVVHAAIEEQFGNPLLAAALDHEENRLSGQLIDDGSSERLFRSAVELLSRLPHPIQQPGLFTIAKDCFLITKALIDDAGKSHSTAPADLHSRVQTAIAGYIHFSQNSLLNRQLTGDSPSASTIDLGISQHNPRPFSKKGC
jgi:hypothetical protein